MLWRSRNYLNKRGNNIAGQWLESGYFKSPEKSLVNQFSFMKQVLTEVKPSPSLSGVRPISAPAYFFLFLCFNPWKQKIDVNFQCLKNTKSKPQPYTASNIGQEDLQEKFWKISSGYHHVLGKCSTILGLVLFLSLRILDST